MLRWFRRTKPQAEPPEHWTLARSDEDGKPVAFRFRSIVPPGVRTVDYPHLINIYWRFDGADTNGLPTAELYDRMARLETLLEAIEGPGVGYLVLSITGNGRKEWIWYVADKDRYLARVDEVFSKEAASSEGEPFPVEFESAPDPEWNSYTVLLRVRGSEVH